MPEPFDDPEQLNRVYWIGHQWDDAERPTFCVSGTQSAADALKEICGMDPAADAGEARGKIDAGPYTSLAEAEAAVSRLETDQWPCHWCGRGWRRIRCDTCGR